MGGNKWKKQAGQLINNSNATHETIELHIWWYNLVKRGTIFLPLCAGVPIQKLMKKWAFI